VLEALIGGDGATIVGGLRGCGRRIAAQSDERGFIDRAVNLGDLLLRLRLRTDRAKMEYVKYPRRDRLEPMTSSPLLGRALVRCCFSATLTIRH
jgi:hypothetical protein